MVFQSFLLLHITGFVIFAGTTLIDAVTFRQFWKQYESDQSKAAAVLQAIATFPRLMGAGIGLLIISGVGMMAMTHGAFGEQVWFRIKFALVLILIGNLLFVGRQQSSALRKMLTGDEMVIEEKVSNIKRNLNRFHLVQVLLIFTVLLLSVFKFN